RPIRHNFFRRPLALLLCVVAIAFSSFFLPCSSCRRGGDSAAAPAVTVPLQQPRCRCCCLAAVLSQPRRESCCLRPMEFTAAAAVGDASGSYCHWSYRINARRGTVGERTPPL
ncbi:hypothetical protein Taro_028521, partial [Colocasia esculenta]|nr:hypothetical protein [Colocasia esculenta]